MYFCQHCKRTIPVAYVGVSSLCISERLSYPAFPRELRIPLSTNVLHIDDATTFQAEQAGRRAPLLLTEFSQCCLCCIAVTVFTGKLLIQRGGRCVEGRLLQRTSPFLGFLGAVPTDSSRCSGRCRAQRLSLSIGLPALRFHRSGAFAARSTLTWDRKAAIRLEIRIFSPSPNCPLPAKCDCGDASSAGSDCSLPSCYSTEVMPFLEKWDHFRVRPNITRYAAARSSQVTA